MTTYVPFSLTYLLPADGSIQLTSQDFASASGKIGPVTVKLTNKSMDTPAIVSYSNPYVPPSQPITYPNVSYDQGGRVIHLDYVTIVPGTSATAFINGNSTSDWAPGDYFTTNGADTGGTSPENDLTWLVTTTDPMSGGVVMAVQYAYGVIPGGTAPQPVEPTAGSPTQTIIIGPGQTEYVQIPGSIVAPDYVPLVLYASGSDVFVTPVQIIA